MNCRKRQPHSIEPSKSSSFPFKTTKTTTWYTTRAILLQSLGGIYFVAFLTAYYQNDGLIGDNGLMPAKEYFVNQIQSRYHLQDVSTWEKFRTHPSIFWWLELTDDNLHRLYLTGMTLSFLVLIRHGQSMLILFILWILYFSIVTTANGTPFYSYGWESQLLETGFLAIFLCKSWIILPILSSSDTNRQYTSAPPSSLIVWLFRWLSFRISMGAGLIKIRGDSCWTDKTCLLYHFETQPIPSPTSFIFHFLSPTILSRAVDLDLFVQVYTSWMVLLPTYIPYCPKLSTWCLRIVRIGGIIQTAFMINIIVSGNLGFLPHLTIVPALACFDDECWPSWIRGHQSPSLDEMTVLQRKTTTKTDSIRFWIKPRPIVNGVVGILLLRLSWPVVTNLLQLDVGRQQLMNASFDTFRLVNTYGAFGSVGKQRFEPIISIAYQQPKDSSHNGTASLMEDIEWIELEFPCKPGAVYRRPCFCEPYHYRLDWNIWFIGFKPHQSYLNHRESWLYTLLMKLFSDNEVKRPWLDLLEINTAKMLRKNYHDNKIPKYAKVDMYHYQMTAPLWRLLPEFISTRQPIRWWNRTFEENLIPTVTSGQEGRLVLA